MMRDNRQAAVLAAFAADSLALGPHWIYNTDTIESEFGRVDSLAAPGSNSFHKTKEKGDFTHYGDQMLVLLRSAAEKKAFDLKDFSTRWRRLFEDYDGYIDGATRKTLANYEKGKGPKEAGSPSNDFAGAARIAPLVCLYSDDPDRFAEAARSQTAMTHHDEAVIDASAFFARVVCSVLEGAGPTAAIQETAELEAFSMSPVSMYIEPGLKSKDEDTIAAVKRFGQACEVDQAFPATVHLIAKYEGDPKEALIQSVMAGGDSAARGSAAAMVLAAHSGMDAVPRAWVEGMNRIDEIRSLIDRIG